MIDELISYAAIIQDFGFEFEGKSGNLNDVVFYKYRKGRVYATFTVMTYNDSVKFWVKHTSIDLTCYLDTTRVASSMYLRDDTCMFDQFTIEDIIDVIIKYGDADIIRGFQGKLLDKDLEVLDG